MNADQKKVEILQKYVLKKRILEENRDAVLGHTKKQEDDKQAEEIKKLLGL